MYEFKFRPYSSHFLNIFQRASKTVKVHLLFLYKQPVYKQLALGWQIVKQLSGLKPLSLSNNKN